MNRLKNSGPLVILDLLRVNLRVQLAFKNDLELQLKGKINGRSQNVRPFTVFLCISSAPFYLPLA
jgi:hypothetical protein